MTFTLESVNTILSPSLFRFAPSLTVFVACFITHLSIYTYFIKLFCNIGTFHMKRTRWTRIALALQFDDYSDNLLESSLARSMTMTMSINGNAMAMSIANGYGYGYALMRLFLCAYSYAPMPMRLCYGYVIAYAMIIWLCPCLAMVIIWRLCLWLCLWLCLRLCLCPGYAYGYA